MYCPVGLSANTKPRIAPIPAPAINPNENRNRPLYIFNNPIRTTEPITRYCVGIIELKENFLAGGDDTFSFLSTILIGYLEFFLLKILYTKSKYGGDFIWKKTASKIIFNQALIYSMLDVGYDYLVLFLMLQ